MVIPKNSKDVAAIRNIFTAIRVQMNSAATAFSEPLKNIFAEITTKFDAVLASLPKDEAIADWCLENQLENLFSLLAQASAVASMAGLELSQLKADLGKNLNSGVTAEIDRRITAGELVTKAAFDLQLASALKLKIEAGELVPKEMHTQLCSAAKTAGITEGATAERLKVTEVEQRQTLVKTRSEGLTTASIPLPPADLAAILGETEENFTALRTTFDARKKKLTEEGFQLNSELLANCWLPAAEFTRFEKILASTPSLKIKPEPFMGGPGGETKTGARFIV